LDCSLQVQSDVRGIQLLEGEGFVLVEEEVYHDLRGWDGAAEAEDVADAFDGVEVE
jgi:hypothetical protein